MEPEMSFGSGPGEAGTVDPVGGRDPVRLGTWAFAALFTAIALFLPQGHPDRGMAQSLSTVWVSMMLLWVVFFIAPFRRRLPRTWKRWRTAWTASWVVFMIHCAVSILGPLGGSLTAMFDSPLVSSPEFNLVLGTWWSADVLLSWLRADHAEETAWIRRQRIALLVVLLIAFIVASVVQGSPTAKILGVALALTAAASWLLRRSRHPAMYAAAATVLTGFAILLAFPTSREEVWSLADCAELVASGFRPVSTEPVDRFLGKVQEGTARCRGGHRAVSLRSTPWGDWANYWGTGDSTSLALPWSPLGVLSPAGRGIDGALLDLEYQRIELIQHNLFDNTGTFDEYVLGRDGREGRTLSTWPEMRLPQTHEQYVAVGGPRAQLCSGDLIRWRTRDGICNDIRNPAMGSSGMAFARNVPFEETFPDRGLTELTRNRHGDRIGLLAPNPQLVSRRLFTRVQSNPEACGSGFGPGADSALQPYCDYQPAPFFNVLAAFWIQFMTHDWFSHLEEGRNAAESMPVGCGVGEAECDPAARMGQALRAVDGPPPSFDDGGGSRWGRAPTTFNNNVTAWWDASQIYGFDATSEQRVKRDPTDPARLMMRAAGPGGHSAGQGLLPLLGDGDPINPEWAGQEATGFPDNWSIGLSFLHNVFAREHNLFVDEFRRRASSDPAGDSGLRHPDRPEDVIEYREVTDDELYQVARLVVAAEIAKIHTIEWTTQLLYNEPLYRAMNANWTGLFSSDLLAQATERVVRRLARSDDEAATTQWYSVFASGSGIFGLGNQRFDLTEGRDVWDITNPDDVNGGVNHFGSPFNFPEEFTTVYRLHPLVPDMLELRSADSPDHIRARLPVVSTFRGAATPVIEELGLTELGLSLGRQRLGLLGLQNHPQFLQNLPIPAARSGSGTLDVIALDLIRDRERGIPRFNEFRRQYGLRSLTSFDDFVDQRLPVDSEVRRHQEQLVLELRELYGQHRCDDSLMISVAQELDGAPTTDCLGHPDGTVVDNVEDLDTVVGYLAEAARPHGFAISETQFVVFILNASRRLFSDRFFTSSFRPEFYGHLGVEWVTNNGPDGVVMEAPSNGHQDEVLPFKRLLMRTVPELAEELEPVINAFDPWARDRGGFYSLAWTPRPGAENDESFRPN